jgi:sodium-dependent phosphate transporter
MGPLLWKRPAPEDAASHQAVSDYRIRKSNESEAQGESLHDTPIDSQAEKADRPTNASTGLEGPAEAKARELFAAETPTTSSVNDSPLSREVERPQVEGVWILPSNLWIILRHKIFPTVFRIFTHGSSVDIHAMQAQTEDTAAGARMKEVYARAKQYPNETEHLFSFMQVLTSCTASFAHGANDLSNAIGPFAVIYHTWKVGPSPIPDSELQRN